ncbi:MAG: (2Fe-2S)-binding protein [Ahrensia sp.]|nr:(2Fe-2S)-binding protein [Ahrensia sp.]
MHDFLDVDAWQLITVGMVYHAMEKRGKCCRCFPNAIAIIVDCVEAWHRKNDTPEAEVLIFVAKTRDTLCQLDAQRIQQRLIASQSKAA